MRRTRVSWIVGMTGMLILTVASPANAGQHDWNSETTKHYHDSYHQLYHRQYSVGGGYYRAVTVRQGWANLIVQGKYYDVSGNAHYTSEVVADHTAIVTQFALAQHKSIW